MASEAGKGDTRRPLLVSRKEFERRWNRIFAESSQSNDKTLDKSRDGRYNVTHDAGRG